MLEPVYIIRLEELRRLLYFGNIPSCLESITSYDYEYNLPILAGFWVICIQSFCVFSSALCFTALHYFCFQRFDVYSPASTVVYRWIGVVALALQLLVALTKDTLRMYLLTHNTSIQILQRTTIVTNLFISLVSHIDAFF